MKKLSLLFLICSLFTCIVTGCADVAASNIGAGIVSQEDSDYSEKMVKTAAPMEEGYYMVEGTLSEMDKSRLALETDDGQVLCFELAPETVIYSGENDEIVKGQRIRVVFDGDVGKNGMEKVSVITVTPVEV